MRRREFISFLGGIAATWPLSARAQQSKISRAFASLISCSIQVRCARTRFDGFFQGLHDLGYVDGQAITIDYLSADGRGERFPALAAECLRLKADIIAVSTTPAAQAAKTATHSIPSRGVSHGAGRRPTAQPPSFEEQIGTFPTRPLSDSRPFSF
jgi:putative tryptophan/tyrosine transport system substrate-binding protein